MTSILMLFPVTLAAAEVDPVTGGSGLNFQGGFKNVYSASNKLTSIPQTFEATMLPKGSGYQEVITFTGSKLTSASAASNTNRYDVNVPYSVMTIDQVHAGTNEGYGPSLRLYAFCGKDGTYREGSVIFLGALEGNDNSTHDDYPEGPVHIALTIDTEKNKITLYRNGVEWTGPRKYEYLAATGGLYASPPLTADDAGFVALYKKLTIDTMPCHSVGGDFRMTDSTENDRWFRGTMYSAAMYSDIRTVEEIESDAKNVIPKGDAGLLAWYDMSAATSYGTIPDQSGNGNTLKKGFGNAAVSKGHVPADFDGDGVTDAGAVAISSLEDLLKIERFENKGGANHVGKGGKFYLTKNIVVPASLTSAQMTAADRKENITGKNVLYYTAASRFTESIYLDGCGYTIEFDKSNKTNPTALGLFGHGTYAGGDGSKKAELKIWNLNVSGNIILGSDSSNISAIFRTGTSGYTEYKNLVVSTNITVAAATCVTAYDKNGKEITITGAQRSVAGIQAKTINGKVHMEDVTFAGSVVSADHMHDDGGAGDTSIYNSSGNPMSFYQTGLGGFIGTVEGSDSVITFKNCINMGTIKATGQVGDDAGFNYPDTGSHIGGFIGRDDDGSEVEFDGCINMGDIVAYNSANMGANLAGFVADSRASVLTIKNSKNLGVIRTNVAYNGTGNASGFIGRAVATNIKVYNSTNEGAIYSTGRIMSAGILSSASWQNVTMDGVFNSGSVTMICDRTNTGTDSTAKTENSMGNFSAGGIVAYLIFDNWKGHDFKITNSGNSGAVHFMLPSNIKQAKDAHVGGIIGAAASVPDVWIENCTNSGDITYDGSYSAWGSAGGIAGSFKDNSFSDVAGGGGKQLDHKATVKNCVNTGNIIGADQAGGILSGIKNFRTIHSGDYNSAKNGSFYLLVQGCKNFGDVKSVGVDVEYGTGGIVGDLWEGSAGNYTYNDESKYTWSFDVLDCYNAGYITASAEYVGGIVGEYRHYYYPATFVTSSIRRCVNVGEVYGTPSQANLATRCGDSWTAFAGGIIAYVEASITGGNNLRSDFDVTDCINYGEVHFNTYRSGYGGVEGGSEGYGTFPIVNCCENRAENRFGTAVTLQDVEGSTAGYYVGHINGGPESTEARNSGNLYYASKMTGRAKGEAKETYTVKYTVNGVEKSSTAKHNMFAEEAYKSATNKGYWSCQEYKTQGNGTYADENHWHEFSTAATAAEIGTKIDSIAAVKHDDGAVYFSAADKGILKAIVNNKATLPELIELMNLLSLCYTYDQNDYTTETWAPFFRARAEAEKPSVFEDSNYYNSERIQKVIDKLSGAKNNLVAPDYTALINVINNTTIPEERLHNYEMVSRMEYVEALKNANAALTSRTQNDIKWAAETLQLMHDSLVPTTPAYIVVIPASLPSDSEQELSVTTREFRDDCKLDVKIQYNGRLLNGQDYIDYDIVQKDVGIVTSNTTEIIKFVGYGGTGETTKKAYLTATNLRNFSNEHVSGNYVETTTFKVTFDYDE